VGHASDELHVLNKINILNDLQNPDSFVDL